MPRNQRLRWLELLSYIHALVYHERQPHEISDLQQIIESSIHSDELRQEVKTMHRTMADVLIDRGKKEGKKEGLQESLLHILRKRFVSISPAIVAAIQANADLERLREWLDAAIAANNLDDVGILS